MAVDTVHRGYVPAYDHAPWENVHHDKVGEPIRLGVCVGYSLEPGERMGRLVAIRYGVKPIETYVIRMYEKGDTWFPTGKYHTTSSIFLQPHDISRSGECKESAMVDYRGPI